MTNTRSYLQHTQPPAILMLFSLLSLMLGACGDVTPVVTGTTSTSTTVTTTNNTPGNITSAAQTITMTASNTPTLTLRQAFPALASLATDATAIRINKDWQQLTTGNIERYTLKKLATNSYTGLGEFQTTRGVQGPGISPSVRTTNFAMSPSVVQAYLNIITRLPIKESKYAPGLPTIENYFYEDDQIDTPAGPLNLHL